MAVVVVGGGWGILLVNSSSVSAGPSSSLLSHRARASLCTGGLCSLSLRLFLSLPLSHPSSSSSELPLPQRDSCEMNQWLPLCRQSIIHNDIALLTPLILSKVRQTNICYLTNISFLRWPLKITFDSLIIHNLGFVLKLFPGSHQTFFLNTSKLNQKQLRCVKLCGTVYCLAHWTWCNFQTCFHVQLYNLKTLHLNYPSDPVKDVILSN